MIPRDFLFQQVGELREEITRLKQCQIDYVRLAAVLFGATISAVGILASALPINWLQPSPLRILLYVAVLSIVVLIYPYLIWIIIHKCRSIFRIVAFIRFVEERLDIEPPTGGAVPWYRGYERLYRKLREHPWLDMRMSSYFAPKRILMEVRSYSHWANKMRGAELDGPPPVGFDGRPERGAYIGDYYGKLLFFLKLLVAVAWSMQVGLLIYAGMRSEGTTRLIMVGGAIASGGWLLYHHLLSRRYVEELRYRPFSIDAYYDMWRWADYRLNAPELHAE